MTATEEQDLVVGAEDLRRFAVGVFERVGLAAPDAALAGEALVHADLRGVHSHGVQNLARWARGYTQGLLNPTPSCELVVDAGALATMDADNGLGAIVGCHAMDLAIARAKEHGIAAVGVRRSSHFGAAAWLTMRALEHDQIGYCATNGPPVMAPWGGSEPVLSNNPFSYAVPTASGAPIVLDIACSASARGRIRARARDGLSIPSDWALDADGMETEDAAKALEGSLLSFGGHKGYGIAVVHEVLAGALTGALFSHEMSLGATGAEQEISGHAQPAWGCGHWLMAVDIAKMTPLAEFQSRLEVLRERLTTSAPRPGVERVYLPGEIEYELRVEREAHGIPLSSSTVGLLDAFSVEELGEPSFTETCAPRPGP